jgi:hypothetical protein
MNYAEDVNYWKTGRSSADTWLEKAKDIIRSVDGEVLASGSFTEDAVGRAGFVLTFSLDGEYFTIKWPVLESKTGNLTAARIQAATALYHEVKSACVKLKFIGSRSAFFAYLQLPDGRMVSEARSDELSALLPSAVSEYRLIESKLQ